MNEGIYFLKKNDFVLKDNIKGIGNPMRLVEQLNGVSYNFRLDEYPEKGLPEGRHFGLLAQDVEKVMPDAVKEGPDGMKAIAYNEIIPLLVEALKLQEDKNKILEETLRKMEYENEQIHSRLDQMEAELKQNSSMY
jgi:hypothetical protein